MVTMAHAACGGFIGCVVSPKSRLQWFLVAILSLGSHVLLDFIPHWDYPWHLGWIIGDILAAAGVTALIMYICALKKAVAVGAVLASMPDIEHLLVRYTELLESQIFLSHLPWFPHGQMDLPWGGVIQIVFTLIFLVACQYITCLRDR